MEYGQLICKIILYLENRRVGANLSNKATLSAAVQSPNCPQFQPIQNRIFLLWKTWLKIPNPSTFTVKYYFDVVLFSRSHFQNWRPSSNIQYKRQIVNAYGRFFNSFKDNFENNKKPYKSFALKLCIFSRHLGVFRLAALLLQCQELLKIKK